MWRGQREEGKHQATLRLYNRRLIILVAEGCCSLVVHKPPVLQAELEEGVGNDPNPDLHVVKLLSKLLDSALDADHCGKRI